MRSLKDLIKRNTTETVLQFTQTDHSSFLYNNY